MSDWNSVICLEAKKKSLPRILVSDRFMEKGPGLFLTHAAGR